MNLFELFVKIGVDDKASPAMKNTQKNSETLTNKIKVMSAQFEAAQKNVDKLSKEFNESVQKTGATSKATQELAKKLDDAEKEAKQAKQALDEYNSQLKKTSGGLSDFATKLGEGLKRATQIGVTAITALGTISIKTFSDFEQLAGGAELMFGDAFETVMENAKNAYKTVQMSQNEYLQQVNGFATGLKTALGGNEQAAADLAHRIVQAEADVVAATGNTAENVQNAFNGIMKSNFTMLDNLQIGITPTKEGFQEVIDKVNEWNKANGEATNYQMGNLADMQSALVDYIGMVGMSGYAQKEASGTIQGSFASMKAAASDFATSLIDDNADVGESWNKLKGTISTFVDNIKPKIQEFLESISPIATVVAGITGAFVAFKIAASISTLLSALIKSWKAYKKANEGATIAQWALNAAMNANPIVLIVTLIAGLVTAIITLWNTNEGFRESVTNAWESIKNAFSTAWEFIKNIFGEVGEFFSGIWESIKGAFSDVGGWFSQKFTEAKENAAKSWENAKELFGTVWNKTKEAFSDVGGWFKNKFEQGKNSAASAWSNAKEVFGGIWENIKNVFSGGFDLGKRIIEGIKNGIVAAWDSFKAWFTNLFTSIGEAIGIGGGSEEAETVSTDGSHRSGLSYVPYDGYIAELHKGERVLTANEAKGYGAGTAIGSITINIDGAKYEDEQSLAEAVAYELQRMTDRRSAVYA